MTYNPSFSPLSMENSTVGIPAFDGVLQSQSYSSNSSSPTSSVQWNNADRLTISFAPDGTRVSKYTSELYSKFSGLLSAAQLESQILRAFQTWARQTNINVGVVADAGLQFGVSGAIQGDSRFGDIRIGAIPMDSNTYAVTVRHDPVIAGTWTGDILFNSNAVFSNVNDFFAVVMHEAGHALGLKHSTIPTAVMYDAALNRTLTGSDISEVRKLYGNRRIDAYDIGPSNNNNTFHDSSRIKNAGSLNGAIPLVVYGDISVSTDIDYFDLQSLSGYTGAVKFELISSRISLLRGKLSIFDESENLIQSISISGDRGGRVSITLPSVIEGENYVARIEAADSSLHSIGSYALVTTLLDTNQVPSSAVEPVVRGYYWRLEQTDVQKVFLNPETAFFNQDLATNDTFAAAQVLNPSTLFAKRTLFQVNGSLSYANDIDFFRIQAPSDLIAGNVLTITLEAMEEDRLVPDLQVFNASQQRLNARVLVHGNGQLVVQVDGISAGQEFFLGVAADNPTDNFQSGNYNLVSRFDRVATFLESLGQGSLNSSTQRERYHSLYVAEPQMLHLSLSADTASVRNLSQVWVTIYDQLGRVVFRDLTVPGQTRTAKSIVVRPGSYSIFVNMATDASVGVGNPQTLNYQIDGIGVTDPIGPEILSPAEKAFKKAGPNDPRYVYPGGTTTAKTFIVTQGQNVTTPPGSIIPPQFVTANAWYWYNGWLVREVPPM